MAYCNKYTSGKILQSTYKQLDKILNTCEKTCPYYTTCDSIALMQNEIMYKRNEILKCPHCEQYQEFCDCPDLFYTDITNTTLIEKQYKMLLELNQLGYNIVTCGNCGQVFIQKIGGIND